MLDQITESLVAIRKEINKWSSRHLLGLFVTNAIIMTLVLLRTAGYFEPFYTITVNSIVFVGVVLAVIFLGARSRSVFILAFIFWLVAAFFEILSVDVWSERMGIYTFQAIGIGLVLLFYEALTKYEK